VAPILMLHRQRDARYERPCALCERLRTLCERGKLKRREGVNGGRASAQA